VIGLQLVIPGAVALSLYPRIAAATAERSRLLVPVTAGISTAACVVVMAALFVDLHAVFSIFGATYADKIESVRPLLLVLLPIAISNSYVSGLQARHHERSVLRLVIVVAAVNIAGNLALIPVLGIRGALIATSSAEWIAAFGSLAIASRRSIAPSRDLAPSAALMIPAALSFFSIPGAAVSLVLVLWLAIAWEQNAFELRSGLRALRQEHRRMIVEPA
jgi:O-antigen/teichoic acid export membrane protein